MQTEKITLSADEKIGFLHNFCTMLTAGIPIMEIVDSLLEDSKGNQKKMMETIKEDLSGGKRLYSSFAKFPNVFDNVTVNIIKAAEEAGTLEITLRDIKNNLMKEIEFSDKIKSALAYPILIIAVFCGIMLMILTFVIPRIATVFSRMRVTLPLPTRIMIAISNIILNYTLPLVICSFLLLILIIITYRNQKKTLFNLLFRLPLISTLVEKIDLTRFTRSMSLLLTSGIPIITALDLTSDVVLKDGITKAILFARDKVLAGGKLSDGLRYSKNVIPTLMIRIIEAGEKSGTLDRSMQEISDYLDYQVTKSLKSFTTLLEPLIMVVVGILIGGMMLSIIAPIYGLISQVGG